MTKRFFILTIIVTVLLTAFSVNAQILEPVKWKFYTKKISEDVYELKAKATIDDTWHLYSQYFEDGGPIPMKFTFKKSSDYKTIGKVKEYPKPHKEYDDIFEIEIKYFSKSAIFTQKIKILNDKSFTVKGSLEGQACTDTDGRCVPIKEDFEFKIVLNKITNNDTIVSEDTTENLDTLTNDTSATNNKSLTNDANIPDSIDTGKSEINIIDENTSLWTLFWIAFGLGLVAIVTPCVFPMIPMTVSFFMHDKGGKKQGRKKAVFFGFSIIFIYTVIGTLVAVLLGPEFANFLSTHWFPNIIFFLIFIFFAASFLGMFEIMLPNWLIAKSDEQADKGGWVAPFFMAFTLVVVSFSCTGPLVGSILVESAGGQFVEPVIGMLGFSLAFALPFTLFAFFPQMLQNIPKSGGWLNSVKVILGFLELALGLKFLSMADLTYHWGLLDREVYLALWIVIFTLMGFYLLGKLKFSHDSDLDYIKVPRLGFAVLTFAFVIYMIPGMFGAPLKALSGYLPPMKTHDYDLNRIIRDNTGNNMQDQCGDAKYSDFLELPHGLKGYFDYEQGLACAKEQNKPIFIDFTGHGCVNCRKMEDNVWADTYVLQVLKEDYVIISLYVDDKTLLPKEDWITSSFDGKIKKTLGSKYADYQISRFGMNSQPAYILLDQNGKVLVKKPYFYNPDPKEFVKYLKAGVKIYKNTETK